MTALSAAGLISHFRNAISTSVSLIASGEIAPGEPKRPALQDVLARPLNNRQCAVGWLLACGVMVVLARLAGGVTRYDSWLAIGPGEALAHGQFSCMYPPGSGVVTPNAPGFPLVVAFFATVLRVGHNTVFPSGFALGPHCDQALYAWNKWLVTVNAIRTLRFTAYLAWLVMLGGVVTLLRTTKRGGTVYEVVTCVIIAMVPAVSMTFTSYFHPEDLVAMGLCLWSFAQTRRQRWTLAGLGFAIAFVTQQYSVLVLIPVVLVAIPWPAIPRFAAGALGTLIVTLSPLAIATSGRVLIDLDGRGSTSFIGNSWLDELNLPIHDTMVLSRGAPILLATVLSLVVRYHLRGRRAPEDIVLYVISSSLMLRIAFEVNVWGYFFMAFVVAIVVADAVAGRFRPVTFVWLILEFVYFNPYSFPRPLNLSQLPIWNPQVILSSLGFLISILPLLRWWRHDIPVALTIVDSTPSTSGRRVPSA